ncbi:MAG: TIGR00725 family protein [Chloroflexi bacterium RBG_19FT_COMBO_62_14]|nr:MAG: TIGR00725 family protein [Chloroflexi bacterium RBG_19FT_COMBO_62_14]
MTDERPIVVGVIGGASATAAEAALAEEVGARLAEAGAVVVCGGRGGVMEAVCRGAHQAGGLTVGILPGAEADEGNRFLSLALPTGLGHARNAVVVQASEAIIAIGGGYGTLSEIGLALKTGTPLVGLSTWKATRESDDRAEVVEVDTPVEAVRRSLQAAKERRRVKRRVGD